MSSDSLLDSLRATIDMARYLSGDPNEVVTVCVTDEEWDQLALEMNTRLKPEECVSLNGAKVCREEAYFGKPSDTESEFEEAVAAVRLAFEDLMASIRRLV